MRYVTISYHAPYDIVKKIINEAKSGKAKSEFILTKEEWVKWRKYSKLSRIHQELDWEEFVEFVQFAPDKLTVFEHSDLLNKIKHHKRDNEIILLRIRIFDRNNNDLICTKDAELYMEKVFGNWLVVGGKFKGL